MEFEKKQLRLDKGLNGKSKTSETLQQNSQKRIVMEKTLDFCACLDLYNTWTGIQNAQRLLGSKEIPKTRQL